MIKRFQFNFLIIKFFFSGSTNGPASNVPLVNDVVGGGFVPGTRMSSEPPGAGGSGLLNGRGKRRK